MRRVIASAYAALVLLHAPAVVQGQAGNHWTEQFGNRSMLLSGAVIGSVSDLGLVFYNPARLGQVEKPDFVVTAKGYQWDRITLQDGLGEGVDLKDTNFGGAPTLAAGAFNVPFLEGHRFAYAFLTRRRDDTDVFLRTERSGDILEGFPGEEFFSGTVGMLASQKEDWMGFSWAHPIGGRWSVGLSSFYYNLKRKANLALDLRARTEANDIIVLSRTRTFGYQDQGLLWKAGLSGDFFPLTVGLTVTSPRLSLLAKGRIQYEDILAGLDPDGGQDLDNGLVTSVQRNLPAVTRSPWAVGVGAGVTWGNAVIHVAGEWYSAVPKYVVTEAEPFQAQSTGELTEYRVVEELESVVNGAIGIEWHRGENLSLFASVASNASATPRERSSFLALLDEVSTTSVRLNLPQVGGGFVVSTSYFDLTLGGSYSWASDLLERPVNLPDGGGGPIFGGGENAKYVASRWRFLVGFSFPFADQIRDRARDETTGDGG
ncbi:MAG: hypothetical protein ACWGSQ_16320 [Longimicrobiales bacterium]